MQAPHLMQAPVSIECGFLTVPEMAPTGQTRAQAVQPFALVGDDLIMKQGFADAGRAFLVHDMRDVLVPEEFEGGEHRIRGGLAQAAKGIRLDIMAQLLQLVDILQRAVALGDFVELLEQTLGAHPAGGCICRRTHQP